MTLVTDRRHTYVIYNYYNVTWVGGTQQGCDSLTGLPGDFPYDQCFSAQVWSYETYVINTIIEPNLLAFYTPTVPVLNF
jgi:hypothetical protein